MKSMRLHNKILDPVINCILFLAAFAYLLYGYRYFDAATFHYDEGIVAYGAVHILNKEIPYKDFWTLYSPGVFYLLAVIFKIFGISIKVTRLLAITTLSLTVCGVYLFIKRLCSRTLGFLAFLFCLAWLKSYMVYNRPGQLAILFFILCCFPLLSFINSGRNRWLIVTGVLSGIIFLFRQDFGFYFFSSIFLVVLFRQLNRFKDKERKEKFSLILKNESSLFLGCLIAIIPFFIYFIAQSAFKEFINDAIFFPIFIYPKVRNLPFPALEAKNFIFYLPLFVFILAISRLLFYNWKGKVENSVAWLILFFLFSGLGLFNYTNLRVCVSHLLPTMIPAILLFILLFADFLNKAGGKAVSAVNKNIILSILFLGSFLLLSLSVKPTIVKLKHLASRGAAARLDISRARGFYDDSNLAQSLALAVRYIQGNTDRNEKIFVGNSRHDRLVNSDVMFYFLSERNSATKYYELHPGLTNTEKIQKEIIDDLVKTNVRYIILWSGRENVSEPNESSKSSGVLDLDNFIRKNYRIKKVIGSYIILSRI